MKHCYVVVMIQLSTTVNATSLGPPLDVAALLLHISVDFILTISVYSSVIVFLETTLP